jgi:hypothetical protein
MKIGAAAALAMMTATASLSIPTAAWSIDPDHKQHDHNWNGDRDGEWDPAQHYDNRSADERTMSEDDRVYRGSDGRYYCKRNDGTTGLIVGGIAGGVLGKIIAGGTLGTLLGAGGGALLGRSVDRKHEDVKCR